MPWTSIIINTYAVVVNLLKFTKSALDNVDKMKTDFGLTGLILKALELYGIMMYKSNSIGCKHYTFLCSLSIVFETAIRSN